jgi:hypothetical protein
MLLRSLLPTVCALIAGQCLAQSSTDLSMPAATAQTQVRAVIERWWRAWERGDRALADTVIHPQFIDTDMTGVRRDRAEVLAFVVPPPADIVVRIEPRDISIVAADHVMVANYVVIDTRTRKVTMTGPSVSSVSFRTTDTFVQRGTECLLLSSQQSRIPSQHQAADVLATEKRIADAQVSNDVGTARQSLAEGYTFTLPDGKIVTREQFLSDMQTWWRPLAVQNSEQGVRIFGNSAIVSDRAYYRWQGKEKIEDATERYTDTYVYAAGQWQRASSHASCLAGRCT